MKRLTSIFAISLLFSTASFAAKDVCEQLVGAWQGAYPSKYIDTDKYPSTGGDISSENSIQKLILKKTGSTQYKGIFSSNNLDTRKLTTYPVFVTCSGGNTQMSIDAKGASLSIESSQLLRGHLIFGIAGFDKNRTFSAVVYDLSK